MHVQKDRMSQLSFSIVGIFSLYLKVLQSLKSENSFVIEIKQQDVLKVLRRTEIGNMNMKLRRRNHCVFTSLQKTWTWWDMLNLINKKQ